MGPGMSTSQASFLLVPYKASTSWPEDLSGGQRQGLPTGEAVSLWAPYSKSVALTILRKSTSRFLFLCIFFLTIYLQWEDLGLAPIWKETHFTQSESYRCGDILGASCWGLLLALEPDWSLAAGFQALRATFGSDTPSAAQRDTDANVSLFTSWFHFLWEWSKETWSGSRKSQRGSWCFGDRTVWSWRVWFKWL